VPVRMALIASLLELQPALIESGASPAARYSIYAKAGGIECSNDRCVSRSAAERRYLAPRFWIVQQQPPVLRCAFCDVEPEPRAYGSLATRKFLADTATWQQADAADLIFFTDQAQAAAAKYEPRKEKPKKGGKRNQL